MYDLTDEANHMISSGLLQNDFYPTTTVVASYLVTLLFVNKQTNPAVGRSPSEVVNSGILNPC